MSLRAYSEDISVFEQSTDPLEDGGEELLGHLLYEQLKTVVHLMQQVQLIDEEWLDVLHHVQYGSCHVHHLQQLHSLIITNS